MPKSILTLDQYLDVASRVMAACCASAGQPLTPDELNRFADTSFDAADAFAEKAQSRSR
jgi:hypothetical protein